MGNNRVAKGVKAEAALGAAEEALEVAGRHARVQMAEYKAAADQKTAALERLRAREVEQLVVSVRRGACDR